MNEVPLPVSKPLTVQRLFTDGVPDESLVNDYLYLQGNLTKECAHEILKRAAPMLGAEPNLLRIDGKVTILGDVHGQFYSLHDMLKSSQLSLEEPNAKLLFLGDYVDRGVYGPEIVILLFTLKIKYPNRIFLMRGNHESREMTEMFNFRDQCLDLYDEEFYDTVMDAFDQLPVSAIVNGKYLCMHGGISNLLTDIDDINQFNRKIEPTGSEEVSLLTDLLWSDPAKKSEMETDFKDNERRGCSVIFGRNPVNALLEKHGLLAIIRGHEVKDAGYKMHLWNGDDAFPPVITLFSAPKYCGTYENDAAVLTLDGESGFEFHQFDVSYDEPYMLYPDRPNDYNNNAISFFNKHI